jgi:hypothetical protein
LTQFSSTIVGSERSESLLLSYLSAFLARFHQSTPNPEHIAQSKYTKPRTHRTIKVHQTQNTSHNQSTPNPEHVAQSKYTKPRTHCTLPTKFLNPENNITGHSQISTQKSEPHKRTPPQQVFFIMCKQQLSRAWIPREHTENKYHSRPHHHKCLSLSLSLSQGVAPTM